MDKDHDVGRCIKLQIRVIISLSQYLLCRNNNIEKIQDMERK